MGRIDVYQRLHKRFALTRADARRLDDDFRACEGEILMDCAGGVHPSISFFHETLLMLQEQSQEDAQLTYMPAPGAPSLVRLAEREGMVVRRYDDRWTIRVEAPDA